MKASITSLAFFLLSLSCSSVPSSQPGIQGSLTSTVHQISCELKAQFSLELTVLGHSGTADQLDVLTLGFRSGSEVDVEQARVLLIASIHEILAILNNQRDENFLFGNAPATPDNLEIDIFFYDQENKIFTDPSVAIVSAEEGKLKFLYKSKQQQLGYSRTVEESFEEALAKLAEGGPPLETWYMPSEQIRHPVSQAGCSD